MSNTPNPHLTREQLQMLTSDSEIMVRIVQSADDTYPGQYWKCNFNGYTNDVNEAGVYESQLALRNTNRSQLFELVTPPPLNPDKPGIVLTIKQAVTHADRMQNKMCRWVDRAGDKWAKSPLGCGYTFVQSEAQVFKVDTILRDYRNHGCAFIELLDQELAKELSLLPFKRCLLHEVLSTELIEGLKLAPANPVFRGLILARLGKMPPDEVVGFDPLKDWIEYNCEQRTPLPSQ